MKIVFKKILSCTILSILFYEPVYSEIHLDESIKKQIPKEFFNYRINAASTDQKTLGGYYRKYNGDVPHAMILHKSDDEDIQEYSFKNIGTLNPKNIGSSEILSMSNDGTKAVGYSSENIKQRSPGLWVTYNYENWLSTKLNKDSLINSFASEISPDGKIIKGFSYVNKKPGHLILWHISDRDGKITELDSVKSNNSIKKVAYDIVPVMEQQMYKIKSLNEGICSSPNSFGNKKLCYASGIDFNAQKLARSTDFKFNAGYALNKNVILGGVFLRPVSNLFPSTHLPIINQKQNNSSAVYLNIHSRNKNNFWYFKQSFAVVGGYNLDFHRPKDNQTESAFGRSKLNSKGFMLTAGHNFTLNNDINIDWNFGLERINIFRNPYVEKNVYNPFHYRMLNYKTKLISLNAKIEVPFLDSMKWVSGLSIEHAFRKNIPFRAYQESFGEVKYDLNFSGVKENVFSSIEYKLNKNIKVFFTAGVNHTSTRVAHLSWNSSINFSGTF